MQMDEREANIRATLSDKLSKMIKRHGFDERQLVQVLRLTPDRAKAMLAGDFSSWNNEEMRKMIAGLG
jgi:predicted XRE-type DNA-binding protein